MPPKSLSRLIRLEGMLAEAASMERCDWVDLALSWGYADQSHLCHDFADYLSCSPGALLATPERREHVLHRSLLDRLSDTTVVDPVPRPRP